MVAMSQKAEQLVYDESIKLNDHVIECEVCLSTLVKGRYELEVRLCKEAMEIRKYYDTLVVLCDMNDVYIVADDNLYSLAESVESDSKYYEVLVERIE
jgi:hypothetical protein